MVVAYCSNKHLWYYRGVDETDALRYGEFRTFAEMVEELHCRMAKTPLMKNSLPGPILQPRGGRFCNHEEKNFATTRRKKSALFQRVFATPTGGTTRGRVWCGGQVSRDVLKGFRSERLTSHPNSFTK